MRDAFGGAFSIKLMLIFLILYVSFICVAINYARAFRVKNRIINIIEQYEGYNEKNKDTINSLVNQYLGSTGYHIEYNQTKEANGKSISSCDSSFVGFNSGGLGGHGYCIVKMSNDPEYYKVETYMVFTLPIINVNFPIAIRGETRRIEIP